MRSLCLNRSVAKKSSIMPPHAWLIAHRGLVCLASSLATIHELRHNDFHGVLVLELHGGGNETVPAMLERAIRARNFLAKVCSPPR